jgi:hypothetical protein
MLKNQMKKLMLLFAAIIMLFAIQQMSLTSLANYEPFAPETLSLTPGATARDLNLAWYSNIKENPRPKTKFIEKNTGNLADLTIGVFGRASAGKLFHKVSVTGLKPDTEYKYAVSVDGETWSQFYPYKTAAENSFRFALVGDPQITNWVQDRTSNFFSSDKTVLRGWKDTISKIAAAEVSFIAGVGDQVDLTSGSELEYRNFFAPPELRSIPFAPAIGNHDRHFLFQYHFNLPNEQKFDTVSNTEREIMEAAGNYWYSYNNALFVVLNTSAFPANAEAAKPYIERFGKTLADAVEKNKGMYKWLFVQHHKSTHAVAAYATAADIRYYVEAGFEKLMDKYGVDVVFAGHDHVYARSYVMKGGQITNTDKDEIINPNGSIYLTVSSASGSKYYDISDAGKRRHSINVSMQTKKPQYTIIDVTEDYVLFNTYDIDSDNPVDTFRVTKKRAGL